MDVFLILLVMFVISMSGDLLRGDWLGVGESCLDGVLTFDDVDAGESRLVESVDRGLKLLIVMSSYSSSSSSYSLSLLSNDLLFRRIETLCFFGGVDGFVCRFA